MFGRRDNQSVERLKFYEAARAEIIQRITLRDQILIAYIATIGGYFAFVMTGYLDEPPSRALMVRESLAVAALPVLCYVFSFVVLQHHTVISQMAQHIREELYPVRPDTPRHWDNSEIVDPTVNRLKAREVAQGMILLLPSAFLAVYFVRNVLVANAYDDAALMFVLVVPFDFIMIYATARLHVMAFEARKTMRRSRSGMPSDVG